MPDPTRPRPRLAAVTGAALLLAFATGHAQPEPQPTPGSKVGADDWLRVGLERYQRANYTGAIDAFERAFAIESRPTLLFAIAQAHRLRGDCTAAVAYYRRFLATYPPDQQAAAADEHLGACEAALASAPPPPPPDLVTATPPPSRGTGPAARAVWRDPVVLGTGGGAVVLVGGSLVLVALAHSAADAAAVAPDYDRHRTLRRRAEHRQVLAAVSAGAGLTLAGIAAWRAWRDLRAAGDAPRATHVTPSAGPDHVGLTVTGSF